MSLTVPGGTAIHLGAVREAVITGNVRGGSQCSNETAENALVTVGSDPQYFVAEDVTIERNRRWTSALAVHARIENSRDNGVNLHTFRSSTLKQRNYAHKCCTWTGVRDSHVTMPMLQPNGTYDGLPSLTWTVPNIVGSASTVMAVAWQTTLESSPGLAGQVVWFAVQVLPILPADCTVNGSIGLAIDPGNGKWQYSCNDKITPHSMAYPEAAQPRGCLHIQTQRSGAVDHTTKPTTNAQPRRHSWLGTQSWQLLSFQAAMSATGTAKFGIRVDNAAIDGSSLSGTNCAIQMKVLAGHSENEGGSVAVAPVGVDYMSI